MAQAQYEGYQISAGFLDGNMGDLSGSADRFAEVLKAELEAEFPGASVTVDHQPGEGSLPWALAPSVVGPEGPDRDLAEVVHVIMEGLWARPERWAD